MKTDGTLVLFSGSTLNFWNIECYLRMEVKTTLVQVRYLKFETKKDIKICVMRACQQKLTVELQEEVMVQHCAHISVVIVVEFQNEEN